MKILFFCLSVLACKQIWAQQFVVWNVGQGLWTTWIQSKECWHFDLGGENLSAIKIVARDCEKKLNRLFLSHWDLDHINFVPKLRALRWELCVAAAPGGEGSEKKTAWIRGLPDCPMQNKVNVLWDQRGAESKTSNEASNVFELTHLRWIIPGDSTRGEEKQWAGRTSPAIKGLVLGHHGSQTSTSAKLLGRLRHLTYAVASARKSRYGHPHREVELRLKAKKIPLLRTEEWGHLRFLE